MKNKVIFPDLVLEDFFLGKVLATGHIIYFYPKKKIKSVKGIISEVDERNALISLADDTSLGEKIFILTPLGITLIFPEKLYSF